MGDTTAISMSSLVLAPHLAVFSLKAGCSCGRFQLPCSTAALRGNRLNSLCVCLLNLWKLSINALKAESLPCEVIKGCGIFSWKENGSRYGSLVGVYSMALSFCDCLFRRVSVPVGPCASLVRVTKPTPEASAKDFFFLGTRSSCKLKLQPGRISQWTYDK